MKDKVNFLVTTLDEANEAKQQQNMNGFDVVERGGNYNDKGLEQTGKTGRTKCLQQIIIFPHQSSWLGPWNYLMNAFLMYGYFHDPWHIAIYLCSGYVKTSDPEFIVEPRTKSMKMQLVLDILLTINIAVKSLTSFQKEVDYVKDIPEIVLNYAKGTMVFDIASTVPALFKDGNTQWFHLKLIRFIHVRSVYGWLSDVVRICLNRFGLDKGSVEKSSHIINLIIYIFSAIHIIGCAWIAVAMIVECSWLDLGGCGAGIPVDRTRDTAVYITSIYWVITTLTTVGYGDYKGYTPTEYVL